MERVILYSIGCPKCNVLKRKLDDAGISFDINESADDMRELGINELPVLGVHGTLLNFSEAVKWIKEQ